MGGALTALAPDFTKSVLGVPGMNYSTLLNRSVDWEGEFIDPARQPGLPAYASFNYNAYPDKVSSSWCSPCCRCCGTGPRATATPST
jgi:hypothetical protein